MASMISTKAGMSRARGSRCGVSLREVQQSQARLRLVSVQSGLAVGLVGGIDVASQAMDLTLPVARLPGRELVEDALGEPVGGALGRCQRVGPRAAQFEDLGAMNLAQPVVLHHRRLSVAPAAQRRGPFPGSVQLEGVLAEGE